MKKSFSKSLIFALALLLATILLALPSCKSLDPATTNTHLSSLIVRDSHDSIATRDSIHTRDSIFVSERQKADTIFRERIVYRDQLHFRDRWRTQIIHDTIIHTDSIVQVIEHPPERYIPPFYKHCTTILWIILAAGIVYIVCKTYIKFRL